MRENFKEHFGPEVHRKVIGAVGLNGSGKDTLIEYLKERCELEILSLGDVARELAHLEGIFPSRDNLHEISQKYIAKYGEDFFVKALIKEIDAKSMSKVGITGIRTPADVDALRHNFGADFLLIHLEVGDPRLRFERLRKRGEARDPDTYEDFLEQEKTEKALFRIDDALQREDLTISNAGTLTDFHREIEKLITQHPFFQDLSCQGRT